MLAALTDGPSTDGSQARFVLAPAPICGSTHWAAPDTQTGASKGCPRHAMQAEGPCAFNSGATVPRRRRAARLKLPNERAKSPASKAEA